VVRALFDVNVLLALFDPGHIHHGSAQAWWAAHQAGGWATCPLTQNGFVRIISRPAYPRPVALVTAMSLLGAQVARGGHAFWPDAISILDAELFDRSYILGPGQITDVCLLALAVKHGGRLVTFDRRLQVKAVRRAEASTLVVL
jgi:toxin-antitoxin system PIN domain toxin